MKKWLLLCLMLPLGAGAEVYKWVDKDGNLHYSDRPPPTEELEAEQVDVSGAELNESQRQAAERMRELRRAQQQREQDREASSTGADPAIVEREYEEQRKKACHAARTNFQIMQSGGRVFDIDADGERDYLDEDEKAARLKLYREKVDEYCK